MAAKTLKDTYDYIFIGNGGPDSYLISSEVDSMFLNDSAGSTSSGESLINAAFFDSTNNTILLLNNATGNISLDSNETRSADDITDLIVMAATSIVLGLMILVTVIGNVFVIAAIILERNLQNVANYLVASLAVADLFVACLVMPLGAVYEISKGWILGPELCDIWTSCDVLCCTASILHLVAIATDRYWAVTNVDYIHSRTRGRVFTMIFLVWFAAVIVSLAPQFGWKDPEYLERIEQQKCMVSQDVAYQVFATCCTFYVPLLVILVLYWKIYQTARKRIHRRRRPLAATANNNQPAVLQKKKTRLKIRLASRFSNQGKSAASSLGLVEGNSTNTVNTVEDTVYSASMSDAKRGIEVTTFNRADEGPTSSTSQISTVSHIVSTGTQNTNESQNVHQDQLIAETQIMVSSPKLSVPATTTCIDPGAISISTSSTPLQAQQASNQVTPVQQNKQVHLTNAPLSSIPNPHSQVTKRKETLEAKRERKAAKTLAIITGAFVVCWLPFFLMALLLPLCDSCYINDTISSFFLWLGYFNSTLNPVIYTIFSPEFRQAFKRILFGGHRPVHYRSGKL